MERPVRVFLDSNVLFSIAYTGKDRSRAYLIYEIQALGLLTVCLSNLVCKEAILNIRRKRPEAEQLLTELIDRSQLLEDMAVDLRKAEIRRLPQNDRIILSTAVYHKADFFLTGNEKDFKDLYRRRVLGTLILKPGDFLQRGF